MPGRRIVVVVVGVPPPVMPPPGRARPLAARDVAHLARRAVRVGLATGLRHVGDADAVAPARRALADLPAAGAVGVQQAAPGRAGDAARRRHMPLGSTRLRPALERIALLDAPDPPSSSSSAAAGTPRRRTSHPRRTTNRPCRCRAPGGTRTAPCSCRRPRRRSPHPPGSWDTCSRSARCLPAERSPSGP